LYTAVITLCVKVSCNWQAYRISLVWRGNTCKRLYYVHTTDKKKSGSCI